VKRVAGTTSWMPVAYASQYETLKVVKIAISAAL
jgi:hypothetical protein